MPIVKRLPLRIVPKPEQVILRPWGFDNPDRLERLNSWLSFLSEAAVLSLWESIHKRFNNRHRAYEQALLRHVEHAEAKTGQSFALTGWKRMLLGAYLTLEYSPSAAALFNPSIVPHPDQGALPEGSQRLLMSLRAVGEGHISSVLFREVVIHSHLEVRPEVDARWKTLPQVQDVESLSYNLSFDNEIPINERILFPVSEDESNGMEDLRLVRFIENGEVTYLGTYTAYDGKRIRSKLLVTEDFQNYRIHPLSGPGAKGKGIAIFPRKIRGRFVALGRQDGQNSTLMYSDDYLRWPEVTHLTGPSFAHDLMHVGNCGSPIETEAGWLVLTHGVGPMRRYVLSAMLLDLEHPERVTGVLKSPLMEPLESERHGYVPNVLYTCGWVRHQDNILLPYAMSDSACGFALIDIPQLIHQLKNA